MNYSICTPLTRVLHLSGRRWLFLLPAMLALTSLPAQTIQSVTHNDTYDFTSSMTNLLTNPDFEQHPAGYSNQAWYAVVNTSSGCGYNVVPGWTGGPAGYECYATLALLRPSGGNLIFNDAYPAMGGTGTCNGPVYPTTPDYVMVNSPLVAATNGTTNWVMYLGDWEDTKKIVGNPALNMATGEVAPMDSVLTFITDNSGNTSANQPKLVAAVSQSVNAPACHTYELEFFLTGEGVFGSSTGADEFYAADGILELTIGSHVLHLMTPGTGNFHGMGSSEIYHVTFTTASSPVTISFGSPGHIQKLAAANSPAWAPYLTAPAGGAGTVVGNKYHSTEVVLDGVRLFDLGTTLCTVLNLELLQFDAKRRDDGVHLSWETAAHTDIRSFEVQRRTDGTDWTPIATISGGGSDKLSYIDAPAAPNKTYYRIRIMGDNNEVRYSTVCTVQGRATDDIQTMPNPVTDRLTITGAPGVVFDEVELMDLTGRRLRNYHNFASGGSIPMNGQPQGIYFVRIQTNKGNKIVQVVLKK